MFKFLLVLSIMCLKSIHIVVSSYIFHSYRFHSVNISWFFKDFFSSKLSRFNDMRFLKTISSYFLFNVWRISNVIFFISGIVFFFLSVPLSPDWFSPEVSQFYQHFKFISCCSLSNFLSPSVLQVLFCGSCSNFLR